MKRYRTEERAYRRVSVLIRHGYWPGLVRKHDDDGTVYWILTHNPDLYEMT